MITTPAFNFLHKLPLSHNSPLFPPILLIYISIACRLLIFSHRPLFLPQYEDSLPIPTIPFLPPSTLSPKKRAVSGSSSPNDDQQNPNKRQKADIARGTRLLSHTFKQSLGSFSTSDERHAVAVKAARNLDEQRHLPAEDTVVSTREPLHSSQSEQYNILICRFGRTIVSYTAD